MQGINKVQVGGHLGKDPEVKTIGSGKVANFSLAASEKYKDKQGNKVETTEWFHIVAWGTLAELAEKYLKKGTAIIVFGKLKTRSWGEEGAKKYITEVHANEIVFLGKPQTSEVKPGETISEPGNIDKDLPF